MRKWVVRFASLLVFNVVVLLVIGWLTPARVGWSALWGGVILTIATIWIKPLITRFFQARTATSAGQRTKIGEKIVQFFLVLIVAFIVWILVVLLSGVTVIGFLWGYLLPPIFLLIAWTIYDAIDDRVEAHAGALYDRATGGRPVDAASPTGSSSPAAARPDPNDGLTAEQRKMLDDLS
ncbi:MAG: hypothetical protein KKH75_08160 [Actinobacteria bacterium]|nr:hypothetical protein [Actinomycetota bacterium]